MLNFAKPSFCRKISIQTGLDKVYDYVMQQPETALLPKKVAELLDYSLPGYKREGKSNITIAIGCTGGKHRSVAISND